MVAENYFVSNLLGTTRSRFVYNAASPADAAQLAAIGNELYSQTPAGVPTQTETADIAFGFGSAFYYVNQFSMRSRPWLGQQGQLAAPFYSETVVGNGLLKATQPGFEGGAGPVFGNVDVSTGAGVAARLSLTGTALRWYGVRSLVAVPGLGEVTQGVGRSSILFARIAVPFTLDQSFFVGGLADVSGALASGPDPSAAAMSGAMAIVKLAGDPTWNAFARAPGSAATTKVAIGPVVATGTVYQLLIETADTSGAVRFTVMDDATNTILGQTVFAAAAFGAGLHHYHFDVGAFTGVAAAREFDLFSAGAVRNDTFKI